MKIKRVLKTVAILLVFALPVFSSAKDGNDNTIVNQLEAPAYWQFPYSIHTVGEAISQVLGATNLKISPTISPSIAKILKSKLPNHMRDLGAMSVFQAIKELTGSQIFVITPSLGEISFSYDKNLSESDLQIQTAESSLQKYLDRADYTVRVATVIVDSGLSSNPNRKEVIAFNKSHNIYFGFNDTDRIVSIADSQKDADYLAKKDISVFYAKRGQTLKETINRWAKKAGYKSYYLAKKDFVIDVPNAFYGSFNSNDGALSQLISSATQAGLDIKAQFNSNDVLVIKDNSYSPILLGGNNE